MEQLRRRFPHTLLLGFETTGPRLGSLPASSTHARTDRDIALGFMTDMRGSHPDDDEAALLGRAVEECCEDSDVDTLLSEDPEDDHEGAG